MNKMMGGGRQLPGLACRYFFLLLLCIWREVFMALRCVCSVSNCTTWEGFFTHGF